MVGARGFEPPTLCAQGSEQKYISLVRIAFLCVTEHGFIRYSSAFGPKLDPSFDSASALADKLTCPLQPCLMVGWPGTNLSRSVVAKGWT
jgi:hypothetical protein